MQHPTGCASTTAPSVYVIFGVGVGYITWRTGGIEIAVVFHAVYNLSAFVFDAALAVDPTVARP